ncbi:MAG: hypothetical protein ACPGEG_01745 [Salibacteraceae bacterium]
MLISILWVTSVHAQQMDGMSKKDLFKVNGSISATGTGYAIEGAPSRRDPFYWMINANINLRVAGIDMPFSATFSQQNSDFGQPFNQFGISPSYKGYTAHLGWRSMTFSPYTYGGNMFLGIGAEAKPKKSPLEVKAFYGRLIKPIDPFEYAARDGNLEPAFERWGYGTDIAVKGKWGKVAVCFMRAKDNIGSITADSAIAYGLSPAENLVYGIHGNLKLTKKTNFKYEIAQSIYTADNSQEATKLESFTWADNLTGVVKVNNSTTINEAMNFSLSHNFGFMTFNAKYKRVESGFQSMGTPFLNNDAENITGGLQFNLFKGKINVGMNLGLQRDNLDNTKKDRMSRTALSGNLAWKATKKLNLNASYSNFSSNTYQVKVIEIDSLSYFNVTQNLTATATYSLSVGKVNQTLMLMGGYQDLSDAQSDGSRMYNANFNYQVVHAKSRITGRLSLNYFNNVVGELNTSGVGPSISLGRPFFKKKINVTLMTNYLSNFQNGDQLSSVYNTTLTAGLKLWKSHMLRIAANMVNNRSSSNSTFDEYRVSATYSYAF